MKRKVGNNFVDEADVTLTCHFFTIIVFTFTTGKLLSACMEINCVVLMESVALRMRVDANARFAVMPIATKAVELVFRLAAVRTKLALLKIAPTTAD